VSLPALSGALAATAILIGVLVAADNSVSDLLAVRTFAEESYTQFLLQFDGRLAVLSAAPLMALLAAMLALARRPLKNWSEAAVTRAAAARPLWPAGGPGGALLSAAGVAIAAPLLMIGLWPLLAKTGGIAAYAGALHQTGPQLVNSMLLGATAACGLTLLAPGWAWLLGSGGRTARAAGVLIVVLLATPAAVVGVSLVELSNARFLPAGWRDSAAIVVLGYFVRFAPLAALLLTPGVRRVPIELESLARVDGCGAAGVLRHVVWPLCRRDAGVATLLLTMLCFGEVIATHLLAPPQWQTAGVRAFTLMHFGLYADLAALGLTGMLATAGLWLALWRLWSWRRAD
jgi:iron(III) transport system permease protein